LLLIIFIFDINNLIVTSVTMLVSDIMNVIVTSKKDMLDI